MRSIQKLPRRLFMALITGDRPLSTGVVHENTGVQLSFLQKVYSLFLLGLVSAFAGAFVMVTNMDLARAVLPHSIILLIVYLAVFFGCLAVRKTPGLNVAALLAFTFVSGVFITPFILFAVAQAGGSFGIVYEAAGITGSIFVGLTVYTFLTKKDFSFLGGVVSIGLWAVLGIGFVLMIASLFHVNIEGASLALAWITSVLFSLFVLYDTSRIMRTHESDEYVSAALSLYLDFLNLFLAILRILSSRRD
jgi:modulator of FtsH protease